MTKEIFQPSAAITAKAHITAAQYDALYTALAAGQPAERALAVLRPVASHG